MQHAYHPQGRAFEPAPIFNFDKPPPAITTAEYKANNLAGMKRAADYLRHLYRRQDSSTLVFEFRALEDRPHGVEIGFSYVIAETLLKATQGVGMPIGWLNTAHPEASSVDIEEQEVLALMLRVLREDPSGAKRMVSDLRRSVHQRRRSPVAA